MKHRDGFLATSRGNIYHQSWIPESEVSADLLIVHGWAEHSARYTHVAEFLCQKGMAVHAYDHWGHGKSDGLRAHIDRFEAYLEDLQVVIQEKRVHDRPFLILGHSMGGLITCHYCIRHKPELHSVVLSSPAIGINEDISPFLIKISGLMSVVMPKLAAVKLDNSALSRDPEILKTVQADPLHYKGGVRARQGAEMLGATRWIEDHRQEFSYPVMILVGSADQLVKPTASASFYTHCGSEDKTMKTYEGAYHELLNELNKQEVMADIAEWISARL